MTKRAKRNISIDIMKTLCISLVVIGHIIVFSYPDKYNTNIIFKICYSFHMPLFIFISGYLTAMKTDNKLSQNKWIINRAKRLLIPYAILTFVDCFVKMDFNIVDKLFVHPVFWFLINLFLYDFITFISMKTSHKRIIIAISFIISALLFGIFGETNLVILNFVMFYIFYWAGFVIKRYKDSIVINKLKKFGWLTIVLYPISMLFFTYSQYDSIVPMIQSMLNFKIPRPLIYITVLSYNHYVVAFLGIGFVWYLINKLYSKTSNSKFIKCLSFVGSYTMQIYIY